MCLAAVFVLLIPWTKLGFGSRVSRVTWADAAFLCFTGLLFAHIAFKARADGNRLGLRDMLVPVCILSVLLVSVALSGLAARYAGAFWIEMAGFVYGCAISLTVSAFASFDNESLSQMRRLVVIMIAMVLAVSLVGLLLASARYGLAAHTSGAFAQLGFFFSSSGKLIGPFERSGQLAAFVVLFAPLLLEMTAASRRVGECVALGALLLLSLVALGATASRTAFVALTAVVFIHLASLVVRRQWRRLLLLSLAVGLAIGAVIVLRGRWAFAERLLSVFPSFVLRGEFTDSFRQENWAQAISLFKEAPIIGQGLGNVYMSLGHEIHSTFLSLLAETGIVGSLGSFASMVAGGVAVVRNIRMTFLARSELLPWARGLGLGLLGYAVVASQHVAYRSRFFWLAIGLVLAIRAAVRQGRLNVSDDAPSP